MKLGRNDVCRCGSGKIYKKCCLARDEETARTKASPAAPTRDDPPVVAPSREEKRDGPELEAWRARRARV